jgi:hypothetical protein
MPYRFIFSTWLIMIPLNIIAVVLALFISQRIASGHLIVSDFDLNYEALLMIGVFSLPFATPGLFGLMIVVWIAREFIFDAAAQFLFITVSCCFIIIGCYLLMELVLQLNFEMREYVLLVSASLAALLATLAFTRRYYYSYLKSMT